MVWVISFFAIAGYNFSFWITVGALRYLLEEKIFPRKEKILFDSAYTPSDVAAIIPAHNEEETIIRTLTALNKVVAKKNIYVASDFSTDQTNNICASFGVHVLDIQPNIGKAKALVKVMKEYHLLETYKLILINDADTEIDKEYIHLALPYFKDPEIAAIATHGVSRLGNYSPIQKYFIAYRVRLWRIIQLGMRFGQTWKYMNVSFIVPGSLSLYRASVLKKIEIDAPGLVIEDFNMTFELHKKKLGKIAYSPNMYGIHQDPYTLMDYIKQVQRWNIGFFQTVKRHGMWLSLFWFFTTFYYIELLSVAFFIGLTPAILSYLFFHQSFPIMLPFFPRQNITMTDIFIGLFVTDYIITMIAAYFEKKPVLLLYGLGFLFLRYIDGLIYIGSLVIAFFSTSSGTWKSPKRL